MFTLRQIGRIDPFLCLPPMLLVVAFAFAGPDGVAGYGALIVAAVAYQIARPVAALLSALPYMKGLSLRQVGTGPLIVGAITLFACTVHLVANDPLVSQRLWTLGPLLMAGFYLTYYVLDPERARNLPLPWRDHPAAPTVVLPAEILRWLSLAVLNEWLIASTSLAQYVCLYALMAITLTPIARWLTVLCLLVYESEEGE